MRERRTALLPIAVSPARLADCIGIKRAVERIALAPAHSDKSIASE
jgi:hypothetical protein